MESLSPEIRGFLTSRLFQANIPFAEVNHGLTTVSVPEKMDLLLNSGAVVDSLLRNRVIGEAHVNWVEFIVSKTIVGATTRPAQIPFVLTTFGLPSLSLNEKKELMINLGIEEPSSKDAKAIRLGASSGFDIEQLGLGTGFAGPFVEPEVASKLRVSNLVMFRPLFDPSMHHEAVVPIVDFALSTTESLLFDYGHINRAFNALDIGLSYFYSPDRTAITREP